MKKDEKLHILLVEIDPPHGLLKRVVECVAQAQRRSARLRLGLFGGVAVLSGVALVPALSYVLNQLYTSGFYDYVSLLSSDSASVALYWREFCILMLETLPSVALLVLIPIVVALVWSLRRFIATVRVAFTPVRQGA